MTVRRRQPIIIAAFICGLRRSLLFIYLVVDMIELNKVGADESAH